MTITTKISANGSKLYYIDGKRVSRVKAIEAAAELRGENLFTIEYNTYDGHAGDIVDASIEVNNLNCLKVQTEAARYDINQRIVFGFKNIYTFSGSKQNPDAVKQAKRNANALLDEITEAYINGARGVIVKCGSVQIINTISEEDTEMTERVGKVE